MLTEADTCTRCVVPKLRSSGWDDAPHSFAQEHCFTDGRIILIGSRALPPEKLVESIVEKEKRILEITGEIKALLAEGPKA